MSSNGRSGDSDFSGGDFDVVRFLAPRDLDLFEGTLAVLDGLCVFAVEGDGI